MAELALIASIVQIADVGLRLSSRLYVFGETVATADRSIAAVSKDIELTSYVLQYLGRTFKDDTTIHSDKAAKTAEKVAQQCSSVFEEIDILLVRKVPHLTNGALKSQGTQKEPGYTEEDWGQAAPRATEMAGHQKQDRSAHLQSRPVEEYSDSHARSDQLRAQSGRKVRLTSSPSCID